MENLGMGAMGMNPLSGMLDSMEMIKRAWSSFQLPSGLAPTMDIDELDRRIKDMKAVEQWLKMNLQMLQGTIQGMEVQRGTLAALQAFGQTMTPPAGAPATAPQREAPAAAVPPTFSKPAAEAAESIGAAAQELGSNAAAAMNPTAWWNLLTSQFEQVAQAALRGAPPSADSSTDTPRKRAQTKRPATPAKAASTSGARQRKAPPR